MRRELRTSRKMRSWIRAVFSNLAVAVLILVMFHSGQPSQGAAGLTTDSSGTCLTVGVNTYVTAAAYASTLTTGSFNSAAGGTTFVVIAVHGSARVTSVTDSLSNSYTAQGSKSTIFSGVSEELLI
jgi:hypothetical protein